MYRCNIRDNQKYWAQHHGHNGEVPIVRRKILPERFTAIWNKSQLFTETPNAAAATQQSGLKALRLACHNLSFWTCDGAPDAIGFREKPSWLSDQRGPEGCAHVQCSYISFSVLFQTNSSLVWKEKNCFCKTQIPNQIQIGLENFDDYCQCPENSKPNSVWFGKIIDYCQRLEPWTNSSFIW